MELQEIEELRSFFRDAPHWDYLWLKRDKVGELSADVANALTQGLGLMLKRSDGEDPSDDYGPFTPIFSFGDTVSAMPPKDAAAIVHALWADIADCTDEPAATARFNDLLWVIRDGPRPDLRARTAINAYVSLAGTDWAGPDVEPEDGTGANSWSSYRRAECLVRALTIARELGALDEIDTVVGAMTAAARETLSPAHSPGTLFLLLEALARLPLEQRPPDLKQKVTEGMDRRLGGLFAGSRLFDLGAKLADDEPERLRIREEQVRRWTEAADAATGFEKLHNLERAIELSRQYGVDGIELLRGRLDSLANEDYELGRISVPLEIEAAELERHINHFVREEGWEWSLRVFATGLDGPPSGDAAENEALVEELSQEHPLQFIIPTVIIDTEGRPLRKVETPEDHRAQKHIQQESVAIHFWGTFAPEVIRRVFERHGTPGREELAEFFTTDIIPEAIADRVARALEQFLEGQFDESAHLLVPRIEAVIRILARRTGLAVSREAYGEQAGSVATLGTLLHGMDGRMDPSWLRYLIHLLVEPGGLNLRNRIAHGLIDKAGPFEAAALIHAACFLRGLSVRPLRSTTAG